MMVIFVVSGMSTFDLIEQIMLEIMPCPYAYHRITYSGQYFLTAFLHFFEKVEKTEKLHARVHFSQNMTFCDVG